jgi:hypothetical protein
MQWCVIDRVDDEGLLHRAAEVHQDPARQEQLRELAKHAPPSWNMLQPTARVLRTGKPLLWDEATQALLHTGNSEPGTEARPRAPGAPRENPQGSSRHGDCPVTPC